MRGRLEFVVFGIGAARLLDGIAGLVAVDLRIHLRCEVQPEVVGEFKEQDADIRDLAGDFVSLVFAALPRFLRRLPDEMLEEFPGFGNDGH